MQNTNSPVSLTLPAFYQLVCYTIRIEACGRPFSPRKQRRQFALASFSLHPSSVAPILSWHLIWAGHLSQQSDNCYCIMLNKLSPVTFPLNMVVTFQFDQYFNVSLKRRLFTVFLCVYINAFILFLVTVKIVQHVFCCLINDLFSVNCFSMLKKCKIGLNRG